MVKIRTICRDPADHSRASTSEIRRVARNPSKSEHPLQQAREYVRALNAAKLDRIFAKPFITALDGHSDCVGALAKNPQSLVQVLSGAYDGQIILWDLSLQKRLFSLPQAHQGFIRGLAYSSTGEVFLSAGDDEVVKLWDKRGLSQAWESATTSTNMDSHHAFLRDKAAHSLKQSSLLLQDSDLSIDKRAYSSFSQDIIPLATFSSKTSLSGLSTSFGEEQMFVTGGEKVQLWSASRAAPLAIWDWNKDSVSRVRFNPSEHHIIASVAMDRYFTLYDARSRSPLKRVALKNKSSALSWNPHNPLIIVLGNEDSNCYSFDLRKLDAPRKVFKGHLGAVLDIDFSPTGRQFVTGSFDRTIRLFETGPRANAEGLEGSSREVYHTSRMQRVFSVLYSNDARYVLSGSDDTNIRIWKAKSSQPLKALLPRQKLKLAYNQQLLSRFKHFTQIKRITRHRHLPKLIFKQKGRRHEQLVAQKKKERNIRANKGEVARDGESKVVAVDE